MMLLFTLSKKAIGDHEPAIEVSSNRGLDVWIEILELLGFLTGTFLAVVDGMDGTIVPVDTGVGLKAMFPVLLSVLKSYYDELTFHFKLYFGSKSNGR